MAYNLEESTEKIGSRGQGKITFIWEVIFDYTFKNRDLSIKFLIENSIFFSFSITSLPGSQSYCCWKRTEM